MTTLREYANRYLPLEISSERVQTRERLRARELLITCSRYGTLLKSIYGENHPIRIVNPKALPAIDTMLRWLPRREAFIIRMRFGLDGYPMTHRQVAAILGVTSQERSRQIEARALSRLRHPRYSQILRWHESYAIANGEWS